MATKWILDPSHSEVGFKVRHLMITNVKGIFKSYDVNAETDGDDFNKAKISFSADVVSIDTNSEQRDGHLKSPDFFDAVNHPKITFSATEYENVDNDGSYELYGDLTIRGISKQVKLDVEFGGVVKDLWGGTRAGFTINGKVDRKEWGLTWNAATEAGGVLVSDTIQINCEIQLVKQQ
jgi:polyisoprenoid-binding protein YceI